MGPPVTAAAAAFSQMQQLGAVLGRTHPASLHHVPVPQWYDEGLPPPASHVAPTHAVSPEAMQVFFPAAAKRIMAAPALAGVWFGSEKREACRD